jgi:hypothetical protein
VKKMARLLKEGQSKLGHVEAIFNTIAVGEENRKLHGVHVGLPTRGQVLESTLRVVAHALRNGATAEDVYCLAEEVSNRQDINGNLRLDIG